MNELETELVDLFPDEKTKISGLAKKIFTDWLVEVDGQSLRVKKLMDDLKEDDFDKRCDLVLEWLRESYQLGFVEGKRFSKLD